MSKILNNTTELEGGFRIVRAGNRELRINLCDFTSGLETYHLVVVKPWVRRKDAKSFTPRKGTVVTDLHVHARSVSEAVALVRQQIDGSGLLVLQASQVDIPSKTPNTMTAALIRSYDKMRRA